MSNALKQFVGNLPTNFLSVFDNFVIHLFFINNTFLTLAPIIV